MTLPPVPRPPIQGSQEPFLPVVPDRPATTQDVRGISAIVATALISGLVVACLTVVSIVAVVAGGDDDSADLAELTEAVEKLSEYPDYGYEWEDEGYYEGDYVVEDDDVYEAVEQPCEDFLDATEALPFLAPGDPVVALGAVRDSVAAVIAAVDGTGADDDDTIAWRDDLEALRVQLDEATGMAAAGGVPGLDLAADGDLASRMYWGSPVGCEPPLKLIALDPDYLEDGGTYYGDSYAS